MHPVATDDSVKAAADHLARHDPVLKPIIERAGLCVVRPHSRYFQRLVESIVGQQLSVKAARTIRGRFVDLFGGTFPTPEQILEKSYDDLRSAGLSNAKTLYVQDLARHVTENRLTFDQFDSLGNDEIIKELVAVKGIGEWTAHMFLMFGLGRLDVLAPGDLGIQNGVTKLYGLKHAATPDDVKKIARKNHWHPYETIACWYVWHSLDNAPA